MVPGKTGRDTISDYASSSAAMQTKVENFLGRYATKISLLSLKSQMSAFLYCSSCFLFMLVCCTKSLYFCMSALYYWMSKEMPNIPFPKLFGQLTGRRKCICVFELLTQSPNISDCQVRKVFATSTISMKTTLQRGNSFKQTNCRITTVYSFLMDLKLSVS